MLLETKRMGGQTVRLPSAPAIISCANVVGNQEGKGPLRDSFDCVSEDSLFGQKTWEQAESDMQKRVLNAAIAKAGIDAATLSYIFAGICSTNVSAHLLPCARQRSHFLVCTVHAPPWQSLCLWRP